MSAPTGERAAADTDDGPTGTAGDADRPPSAGRAPLRLALPVGLCAGLIAAGAVVALLFALGAVHRAASTSGSSPAQAVARYDEGLADVVQNAFGTTVSIDVVTRAGVQDAGTGVVVDKAGLVLTNYHVVEDARAIRVTLGVDASQVPSHATIVARPPPGSGSRVTVIRVPGTVTAVAPARDLAVVRLPIPTPSVIALGDARRLRLGQRVISIGNALSLTGGPTVTSGIVSGFRNLRVEDGTIYRHLIQTDAAINRGNSGGPLIDTAGRLVGISSIATYAGSAEDIGFAIEVNQARPLIDRARR